MEQLRFMLKENNKPTTATALVGSLWFEGFFEEPRMLKDVSIAITQRKCNFSSPDVSKALRRSGFLLRSGKRGSFRYVQKISPEKEEITSVGKQLFSDDLIMKLGEPFKKDVAELHINFGRCGSCTAFLLRKILEKAIYLAFAKQKITENLEDNSGKGRLVGLEAMIEISAREKIGGTPFLLPKTALKIQGIKFLGDTSAHNPLVDVDMETILPQMPFIITAYKELAERL